MEHHHNVRTGSASVKIETAREDPPTTLVKRRDHLVLRRVDRELLLLDTEFNQIHQLNETASFVWDQCDQVPDVVEIARLLAQRFDVEERAALNDVSVMVGRLRDLNLLVV